MPFQLAGTVRDASYLGVSTQYIVETRDGGLITVYEQNVERTSHGSLHRDDSEGVLNLFGGLLGQTNPALLSNTLQAHPGTKFDLFTKDEGAFVENAWFEVAAELPGVRRVLDAHADHVHAQVSAEVDDR